MTAKGVVVIEQEVSDELPPASPSSSPTRTRGASTSNLSTGSGGASKEKEEGKRSPISELLYMRWLEGLKLKWPSIL